MDRPQTVVINVNFIRLLSIQVFRQGFSAAVAARRVLGRPGEETNVPNVACALLVKRTKAPFTLGNELVIADKWNERICRETSKNYRRR